MTPKDPAPQDPAPHSGAQDLSLEPTLALGHADAQQELTKPLRAVESGEAIPVAHKPAAPPPPPKPDDPAAPPPILQGQHRWLLGEKCGRGGYGSVYRAVRMDGEDGSERTAAIKIFLKPKGLDPQNLLKRELASLLPLKSDRIPRVYDWSIDGPVAFVASQFFGGGTLSDQFKAGPIDTPAAWRLLHDLMVALRDAHRASLLHLDIKPANVLLDGNGGFVLTDFGLSQGLHVSEKVMPFGMGTTGYHAPEQHFSRTRDFSMRTDLFSAAATVWSVHTGVKLWQHPELLDYGRDCVLPPLSQFIREPDPDLERLLSEMLSAEPSRRPGSAAEILAQVRRRLSMPHSMDLIELPSQLVRDPQQSADVRRVIENLVDPLWQAVCRNPDFIATFQRYEPGQFLCRTGEESYHVFVLLSGQLEVQRFGRILATIEREGSILGEVATLTGANRTADIRATTTVWCAVLNASEFEAMLMRHPELAIRLLKSMAERHDSESRHARETQGGTQ